MSQNREWMYKRFDNGSLTTDFLEGLESFIKFASSKPTFLDGEKIKCPCKTCENLPYQPPYTVRLHIAKNGFVPNYYIWKYQGELGEPLDDQGNLGGESDFNTYHTMVMDVAASHQYLVEDTEEEPNLEAKKFFDMLKAADKELWPGCKNHSHLSLVARLMALKSEHKFSVKCFDQIVELMKEIVPEGNCVPDNFYSTKKLLSGMGLPVEKIDACPNSCMIYWKEDSSLNHCKYCGHPRFKNVSQASGSHRKTQVAFKKMYYFPLSPRLQRLYASSATAEDMRWHASSVEDGDLRHPADSPTWKHLDKTYPDFASEIRNVRLGLSTYGLQPFGQSGQQYSSWPVILTPYNLPPWMCMKDQHMFLIVLVPGPRNPKDKIDVYLQPLISELRHLWEVGVQTYDVSLKQNFQLRAALLWTISDFPAYAMLSGWSTSGKLACPHCMEDSNAFTLPCSGKQSWFDNHRKFLPMDHSFRRNKRAFTKNKEIHTPSPEMRSGEDILKEIELLGLKKVTEMDDEESSSRPSKRSARALCGWKKISIIWDLPYWDLRPSHTASGSIISAFKRSMHPMAFAWSMVPKTKRLEYFEEFRKEYTWDSAIEGSIYKAWVKKAGLRYKNMVHNFKRMWKDREKPPFITEAEWECWKTYWQRDDVVQKSRKATENRMSEPEGVGTGHIMHRRGSRSAQEYAIKLSEEMNIPEDKIDWYVFLKFHYKNGQYTDVKSKKIADEVYRIATEERQPLPDTTEEREVDMNAIYLRVAKSLEKKNTLFGQGCRYTTATQSSMSSGETSDFSRAAMDEQLSSLQTQLSAEREERLQTQTKQTELEEQIQKQAEEHAQMKAQLEHIMRHWLGPPPS